MGLVSVLLSAVAAFLFYKTGHTLLMVLAIGVAVGCLWSWGVMRNLAVTLAKRRGTHSGGFCDITPGEAREIPSPITAFSIATTFAALALLLVGIVMMMMMTAR